ncbi:MAG TPA: tRNA 2-thiouridine(34) synthase MnmA [Candidatus Paceibacterota bacterium]
MIKKLKVFVGVSGGVDSSVALALLQKATPNNFSKLFGRPTPEGFRGYDVTGVFLKVWNPEWLPCNWKEERRSAMRVCATLGVPFLTFDFGKEYKKEVVDYMIREYGEGRVPNPDVFCNKYVKFGVFLDKALDMGVDFIATGHYAICQRVPLTYELRESADKNKDQSYFLYTLSQEQLKHTLFPVGHLTKPEVRKLAKRFGLPTAEKKDSQGLCFIGKVDMKDFLAHYIDIKKGNVLNTKGEVIGSHDGAMFYTIGQRHGFIIIEKTSTDPRFFVVSKNLEKNTITVMDKKSHKDLLYSTKAVILRDLFFISGVEPKLPLKTSVRIRYRQEKQNCTLEKKANDYQIIFDELQSGVSIGQSAVLYDGEVCLGGGIIEKVVQ